MNKLYFQILLIMFFSISGYAQNILNGDFEINTAPTCEWNLSNAVYNGFISNSWGFGDNTFSGMDIQKDPCGYTGSPSNICFVSICKAYSGQWKTDAFSMKIDADLIAGNTYQISYLEYAYYTGTGSYMHAPLEIGLSTDSLDFGQSIYTSLPDMNVWTARAFIFIAPNSGKYITVRNVLPDTIPCWNFVDNFHISVAEGMHDISGDSNFEIYPNPFFQILNISCNNSEPLEIILYDIISREYLVRSFEKSISINTEQIAKGVYFYVVRNKNGIVKKGKIVKD
jgi:hypothetical protein